MLKRLACGVIAAFALVCTANAEEQENRVSSPAATEPVQLTDGELDQITAGITVVVFNPGRGQVFINEPNRTIIVTGGSSEVSGFILTPSGKFITLPH